MTTNESSNDQFLASAERDAQQRLAAAAAATGTYQRTEAVRTQAVRTALDEVRRTKAPTKARMLIAHYLIALPTQAEVDDFSRQLRINAGVQDVGLLPATTWTVHVSGAVHGQPGEQYGTEVLRNTLADAEGAVIIDWPSATFHWGVMVTFTWGGVHYVARSADYAITETYMSS